MDIDFTNDKASASKEDLAKVSELADKAAVLKTRIKAGEALLKDLGKQLTEIEGEELPALMESFGLTQFKTSSGVIVDVKDIVVGSMPSASAIAKASAEDREELEERLEACLEFIRGNGGESIIKSKAEIDIGKDPEQRKIIAALLDDQNLDYLMSDGVHYQTLQAWIKEKMAASVDIPKETFNLFTGKKATIKLPK